MAREQRSPEEKAKKLKRLKAIAAWTVTIVAALILIFWLITWLVTGAVDGHKMQVNREIAKLDEVGLNDGTFLTQEAVRDSARMGIVPDRQVPNGNWALGEQFQEKVLNFLWMDSSSDVMFGIDYSMGMSVIKFNIITSVDSEVVIDKLLDLYSTTDIYLKAFTGITINVNGLLVEQNSGRAINNYAPIQLYQISGTEETLPSIYSQYLSQFKWSTSATIHWLTDGSGISTLNIEAPEANSSEAVQILVDMVYSTYEYITNSPKECVVIRLSTNAGNALLWLDIGRAYAYGHVLRALDAKGQQTHTMQMLQVYGSMSGELKREINGYQYIIS